MLPLEPFHRCDARAPAGFENLGDEKRISIDVGEEDFLTLMTEDERRYKKGEKIHLRFHEEKTHIFDLKTGDRLQA